MTVIDTQPILAAASGIPLCCTRVKTKCVTLRPNYKVQNLQPQVYETCDDVIELVVFLNDGTLEEHYH